jgi:hypothetical protein
MIILKMRGGLGNQMFQYAAAKARALQKKSVLLVDMSWYKNADRSFLLDTLKIDGYSSLRSHYLIQAIRSILRPTVITDENIQTTQGKKEYLDGWWESPAYFKDSIEIIRNEFILRNPSNLYIEALDSVSKNSISVHVRRGDNLRTDSSRSVPSKEYYETAVKTIISTKKLTSPQITIFSDDTAWCTENLQTLGGLPTTIFNQELANDAEELMFMSHFSHNVVSNSTFSWWAAYLNGNTDKMVVMPKIWFKDTAMNASAVKNLTVPGWTII